MIIVPGFTNRELYMVRGALQSQLRKQKENLNKNIGTNDYMRILENSVDDIQALIKKVDEMLPKFSLKHGEFNTEYKSEWLR